MIKNTFSQRPSDNPTPPTTPISSNSSFSFSIIDILPLRKSFIIAPIRVGKIIYKNEYIEIDNFRIYDNNNHEIKIIKNVRNLGYVSITLPVGLPVSGSISIFISK